MTRAVLDTNTLASGFVTAGGVGDQILQHWLQGHFELIISAEIIDELIGVFAKPYFRAQGRRTSGIRTGVRGASAAP